MSTKYKAKFTDTRDNYEWEVHLFDTSYTSYSDRVTSDGGTVEGIDCLPLDLTELVEYRRMELGADAFELEYGKRGDEWYEPIKGSRVVFDFICSSQEDLDYVDDIAQVQETRFFVRLYRDGSIFWQGPILQDLLRVPYSTIPASVEIQATDGLARLKGLKGTIGQYDNILESIITVLKGLDTGNLWASSDDFLRTSVRWFEDKTWTSSPPNGLDALAYSRLERDFTEYTYDNQGNKVFRKWYDWLGTILRAFNARIFMSDGLWVIEQIGEIANNPSRYNIYQRAYSYTYGNPSTATGVTSTGTSFTPFYQLFGTGDVKRLDPSCSWTYLPSVKEYSLKYDLSANASAELLFLRTTSSYSTFRNIGADTNFGVYLDLQARYHKLVNSSGSLENCYFEAYATVRLVGTSQTYYLAPTATPGQAVWTTIQNRILVVREAVVFIPANGSSYYTQVFPGTAMSTANVPVSGLLSVQYEVEFKDFNNPNVTNTNISLGTITSAETPYFANRGFRAYLAASPASSEPLDSFEYSVENTVDTSSTIIEQVDSLWLGDQLNSVGTNGQIEVYNVTNSAWEPSTSWKIRGLNTAKPILELLLTVMMQLRETPRRLFDIGYYGEVNPIQAFRVGVSAAARNYFWNWLKLNARANYVQSEAYEIEQSATAYNITSDYVYVDVDFADGISRGGNGRSGIGTIGDVVNGISFPTHGLVASEQSGTITSIPVSGALRFTVGFAGDTIQVLTSDGNITEFVLSEDAVAGATSLSVDSKAISGVIGAGARVLGAAVSQATQAQALTKFSISAIPDAKLILQDSGVETTSGFITTWSDSSGNSNDFTVVDVTPNYKGGFYAQLNGASSYLSNVSLNINQPFSLVMLLRLTESTSGKYLLKASVGDFSIITATAPDLTISTGTGPTNATIEIPRDVWNVFQLRVNGASSQYRVNYDSWSNITLDASALIEAPYIGHDGSSNFCETDLAAACIFAKVLTDDEANAIVNNFKARIS